MKFDKSFEANLKKNKTIHSVEQLIISRISSVQDVVNNTDKDHRYFQGYLRSLTELKDLITEATN